MRPLALVALATLSAVCAASCASREAGSFAAGGVDAGDAAIDSPARDSAPAFDTAVPQLDAREESLGPTAQVRIANWSPDAPAAGYDVCLAVHGTSSWTGPVLARQIGDAGVLGDSGVPSVQFPRVTNYLLDVTPGAYDVAVVATGAGCASPVAVTRTLPALSVSSWYTMAIVGDRAPAGADPKLSVVLFTDDSTATIGDAVRFVDVAPSIAAADFGEGTLASGFQPLATDVPFGGLATMAAQDGGATPDANGYVAIVLPGSAALSAHASGGATGDAAVAPNQMFATGAVVTVALVGGKTGGAKAQLVVCTGDGVVGESTGLYSACSVASM